MRAKARSISSDTIRDRERTDAAGGLAHAVLDDLSGCVARRVEEKSNAPQTGTNVPHDLDVLDGQLVEEQGGAGHIHPRSAKALCQSRGDRIERKCQDERDRGRPRA